MGGTRRDCSQVEVSLAVTKWSKIRLLHNFVVIQKAIDLYTFKMGDLYGMGTISQ